MSLRVEYLLEYDSILAIEACSIELKGDFDLAARHEGLELLLSSDLLAVHIKDRCLCSLIHQDSLCSISLTLLQVLVFDHIDKGDLLLRSDVFILSVNRCSRSDLRNIVCDGLKINKSVLRLLIYCEVELLQDISFVMLAWHLFKDI